MSHGHNGVKDDLRCHDVITYIRDRGNSQELGGLTGRRSYCGSTHFKCCNTVLKDVLTKQWDHVTPRRVVYGRTAVGLWIRE